MSEAEEYILNREWVASDIMDNGVYGVVTNDADGYIVVGIGSKLSHEIAAHIATAHNVWLWQSRIEKRKRWWQR